MMTTATVNSINIYIYTAKLQVNGLVIIVQILCIGTDMSKQTVQTQDQTASNRAI